MTMLPNDLIQLDVLQMAGVMGFVLYLYAFGAVQFGQLDGNGAGYSVLNVLAAMLVGLSLIDQFNLASALIQGSWIVIGITGLSLRLWLRMTSISTHTPHFGADQ